MEAGEASRKSPRIGENSSDFHPIFAGRGWVALAPCLRDRLRPAGPRPREWGCCERDPSPGSGSMPGRVPSRCSRRARACTFQWSTTSGLHRDATVPVRARCACLKRPMGFPFRVQRTLQVVVKGHASCWWRARYRCRSVATGRPGSVIGQQFSAPADRICILHGSRGSPRTQGVRLGWWRQQA